jgi:hypothetical protein
MAKKIHRETTTRTDLIQLDNGKILIVGRSKNTQIHEERLTDKENHSNFKKWEELHQQHAEDIAKEQLPSLVQQAEAGEQYALKQIVELHKDETTGEFQVKSIWWEMTLNFLKNKALAFIVGALRGLLKDGIPAMVKFANWLVEQLENVIVSQYKNIEDEETRGIIRNELNQYEQLRPLADKMRQVDENK